MRRARGCAGESEGRRARGKSMLQKRTFAMKTNPIIMTPHADHDAASFCMCVKGEKWVRVFGLEITQRSVRAAWRVWKQLPCRLAKS